MRLVRFLVIVAALPAFAGLASGPAAEVQSNSTAATSAESPSASPRGSASAKKEGKLRSIMVTPEREAAVMTFVQRNHAELADLLGYLKTSQPEAYERAVKDIFRTIERLALVQERDPLQYELEVAAWTAQSRVQLLAARVKMGANDELIKQLREALAQQNDAKLALLRHDHKRVADRLAKIDSDIARFEQGREDVIEKQLKLLTRAASGKPAKAAAKGKK